MIGRVAPPQPGPPGVDGGLWCEISAGDFVDRPALFLDRDGVIVEDTHHLGRAADIRMLSGAAEAIVQCNRLGIPVVVVSNQSGIARGLYDWQGFGDVQAALSAALARVGGHLDAVLACGYHADGRAPLNVADHHWRKPNPGMILAAAQWIKLDLSRSWIVGDRDSDIAAGRAAHLEGGVLLSPKADEPKRRMAAGLKAERFAFEIAASLDDAVTLLVSRGYLGKKLS